MPPSKNISFEELSQYFHLPINAVAKELGVCATILKKTCRKNGIPRWPHRKIKSIDNRIANLQVNLEKNPQDRDEIAKEIDLLKCKKQEIMRNPDILVKSSKSSDASPPPISESPSKQNSTHQPMKHPQSIHQNRSAPYAVKTFKVKEAEGSGSDASPSDDTVASTQNLNSTKMEPNMYSNNPAMNPFYNPQTLYREMMEDPVMSGLNFMANPPTQNRMAEQSTQIALERIMKNHSNNPNPHKLPAHYMSSEYDMPPNPNPYITSPSSLFNDGPASFIQPPATLYNYGMSHWQQQQQTGMRQGYPSSYPSSFNTLYQQFLSQREPYYPPLDLPPQRPPLSSENVEKIAMNDYVSLARASAMFTNRDAQMYNSTAPSPSSYQQSSLPPNL